MPGPGGSASDPRGWPSGCPIWGPGVWPEALMHQSGWQLALLGSLSLGHRQRPHPRGGRPYQRRQSGPRFLPEKSDHAILRQQPSKSVGSGNSLRLRDSGRSRGPWVRNTCEVPVGTFRHHEVFLYLFLC